MKTCASLVNNLFSPRGKFKYLAVLVLVLAAAGLILFSAQPNIRVADFKQFLPAPSDLLTSPVARDSMPSEKNEPQKSVAGTNRAEALKNASAVTLDIKKPDEKRDTISIPMIGVLAPIVTAKSSDPDILHSLLDLGAVLYPESSNFGRAGQTILLGHSAPADWPKIKHDTLFSRLNELSPGDKITAIYGGTIYSYTVAQTKIFEKGTTAGFAAASGNSLVLVSCWPPGHDRQRIAVLALPSN